MNIKLSRPAAMRLNNGSYLAQNPCLVSCEFLKSTTSGPAPTGRLLWMIARSVHWSSRIDTEACTLLLPGNGWLSCFCTSMHGNLFHTFIYKLYIKCYTAILTAFALVVNILYSATMEEYIFVSAQISTSMQLWMHILQCTIKINNISKNFTHRN